jgi:hypothetical protein
VHDRGAGPAADRRFAFEAPPVTAERGRGLTLLDDAVDELQLVTTPAGTTVTFVRHLGVPARATVPPPDRCGRSRYPPPTRTSRAARRTPPPRTGRRGGLVATKIELQIPVERQKAAQAAGNFELEDLPGRLATPDAAVRVGKAPKQDKALKSVRSLNGITKLTPRQVIANYGRSESRWAAAYQKRRAGHADFHELLSYARQIIGLDDEGQILICLMGHAGQGPCIPLWVPREEVTLTVQPNDIILRFDDLGFEW